MRLLALAVIAVMVGLFWVGRVTRSVGNTQHWTDIDGTVLTENVRIHTQGVTVEIIRVGQKADVYITAAR